jgi:hypothetical protein
MIYMMRPLPSQPLFPRPLRLFLPRPLFPQGFPQGFPLQDFPPQDFPPQDFPPQGFPFLLSLAILAWNEQNE